MELIRRARVAHQGDPRAPQEHVRPSPRTVLQAKLEVGAVDDPLEHEADRVADQVVRLLRHGPDGAASPSTETGRVRRSAAVSPAAAAVHRVAAVGAEGGAVDGELESRIRRFGQGAPMEPALQSRMETAFGTDFSAVRLHTDSDVAPELGARAFTHGSDIHLAPGTYRPDSSDGQRLLAHELTHVVQQSGGARRISRLVAPADPKKAQKRFTTAKAGQAKARAKLKQYVAEGRAHKSDERLRNACEWVASGRAKLYAVTRTGDSNERVNAVGMDPSDTSAWFPAGTDLSQPGHLLDPQWNYDWYDLMNNANIEFDDNSTGGWNLPGIVAIVDPHKKSRSEVWETLKHEVQHDSDRSGDRLDEVRDAAMATGLTDAQAEATPAYQLECYKTEYRAYNYEGGPYAKYSTTKMITQAGFQWTERQFRIFVHIYRGYDHTKTGWDDDGDVGGGVSFRQAVVAYRDPDSEGFNKFDSIRIDDLYNEIAALADGTSDYIDMAILHTIPEKIRALTKSEAQWVLDGSPVWQKLLNRKLADICYMLIMDRLRSAAGRR